MAASKERPTAAGSPAGEPARPPALPRISLVTPSFNQGEFLETTLRSVLNQGYPNLEYIVIDGGSTDGSREILERYADRLTYWVSEPDRGHAHAINKGFARTTGEILGWLNSDDILLPGSLSLVASAFAIDLGIEWITSNVTVINPAGNIVNSWNHLRFTRERFFALSNQYIQQESTFWRRSLWDCAGGFVDERYLACDFELWARFFRHARLVHTHGSIGAFRFQPVQKSRTQKERYLREAREIIDRELDHPELATLPDAEAETISEILFDLESWTFLRVDVAQGAGLQASRLLTLDPEVARDVQPRSFGLPPWPIETVDSLDFIFPRLATRQSGPAMLLWLGSGPAQGLELSLRSLVRRTTRLEFTIAPGPARADRTRTLRIASTSDNQPRELATVRFEAEQWVAIDLPLEIGFNRISISILELPTIAAQPNGDSRPLLAGMTSLRLCEAAAPPDLAGWAAGEGARAAAPTPPEAVSTLDLPPSAEGRALVERALTASEDDRKSQLAMLERMQAELRALHATSAGRLERIGALERLGAQARALEAARRHEKAELEETVRAMRAEQATAFDRQNRLEGQLRHLRAQAPSQARLIELLTAEIGAIRLSWSWRLTAPLRLLLAPLASRARRRSPSAGSGSAESPAEPPAAAFSEESSLIARAPRRARRWTAAGGRRRVAFLGHSHHFKTASNLFLLELLRDSAEVELFRDTSWSDGSEAWLDAFEPDDFDGIVMFQSWGAFDRIGERHPNVVFVPMYDSVIHRGGFIWDERFHLADIWRRRLAACKVLCLSSTLYRRLEPIAPHRRFVQYFPEAPPGRDGEKQESLDAFFWYRRPPITLPLLAELTRGTAFGRLTVHDAPDPGVLHLPAGGERPNARETSPSGWFAEKRDFLAMLRGHSLFFASRLHEGIGMSFLEAMAMGLCVVAPDTPTHNEYISHGTNGLLYDPARPRPLDFARAAEIGGRARESAARGRARWLADLEGLTEFLATPTAEIQRRPAAIDYFARTQSAGLRGPATPAAGAPKVSVVTVCLDAAADLERTILSVHEQDHPALEYLLLDGGSHDGTLDIIRRHTDKLDFWRSQPDAGVYAAMGEALDHVKGDFVLFMNAGDTFVSPASLRALFAGAPADADVVYGNHIYLPHSGTDEFRRVTDFEETWRRLRAGAVDGRWLEGMPCHQATAVRTSVLHEFGFDPAFSIAADHELYFRLRRAGRRYFNGDETVAVYRGGGMSAQRFDRCLADWLSMAVRHGRIRPAWKLYRGLGLAARTSAGIVLRATLDRLTGRADRRFPR